MSDRVILHCDLNNFFASVECIGRPELKCRPMAVCGDPEKRHGIILAKNEIAKKRGVKTAETIWTAKAKCPELLLLPAHHQLYTEYSAAVREIYRRYTDQIESFGIDECWLDVTASGLLFGDGVTIANELRASCKSELGLTISAGVSYNKIFAKMGSDYKKPDATTLISRENYKDLLWGLPVEEMMFVGRSTAKRMHLFGIHTIGELAQFDEKLLREYFGKNGEHVRALANGFDSDPVTPDSYRRPPESIGNSTTCPHDLTTDKEVRAVLFALADKVSARLRTHGMKCSSVALSLRSSDLSTRTRHRSLEVPTALSTVLFSTALSLYRATRTPGEKLRGLGIQANKLSNGESMQLSFLDDSFDIARRERAEETVDALRARFGKDVIGSGLYLTHPELTKDLFEETEEYTPFARNSGKA